MTENLNYRINPALFPIVLTNSKVLPRDFRENFHFCGISDNLNFTWISLAYLYPEAKFILLFTDDTRITEETNSILQKLNLSNIHIKNLKEFESESEIFDYVALDISYSFLYAQEREKVKNILKNSLKDEGILYIEYESFPGSEAKSNFFKFIKTLLNKGDFEEAYEVLENFILRPTSYLIKHSDLRRYINDLIKEENEELRNRKFSREVLNEDFKAFYFNEINNELSSLGFTFCGRSDLQLNDPEISLFPAHIPTILRFTKDVGKKETAIDFILNISVHKDIYVKNPKEDFEGALKFICENYYLIPRQTPANLRRIVALPGGHRYPLTSAVYDYFFTQGENPVRLCSHPLFEGNKEAVWKAFYKVLATGDFFLCIDENLRPLSDIKQELPNEFSISPLNATIIEHGFKKLHGVYLISEITKGACLFLTPLETILFWFSYKEGKEKALEQTYEYLQSLDKKITLGGELKSTKEISKEDIEKIAKNLFTGRKAFNLQRLRIVEF